MELYFSRSCDYCRKRKIRCSREKPSCHLCAKKGHPCTRNNPFHKRGPKSKGARLATQAADDLNRALDASTKLTQWLFATDPQIGPWDYAAPWAYPIYPHYPTVQVAPYPSQPVPPATGPAPPPHLQ